MKQLDANNEWVPQKKSQEYRLIRRRLRKRKKRPPIIYSDSFVDGNTSNQASKQGLQHYLLNENSTPWEEVPVDDVNSYVRRRLPPTLMNRDELTDAISNKYPNINNETSANNGILNLSERNLSESSDSHTHISNIKLILKQTPSKFSLSEVLQQKNLSLVELLSGNKEAFFSITQKPTTEFSIKQLKDNENNRLGTESAAQNRFNKKNETKTPPVELVDNVFQESNRKKGSIILNPIFNGQLKDNISSAAKKADSSLDNKLPTTNAKSRNSIKLKAGYDLNRLSLTPIKINLTEVIGFKEIVKNKAATNSGVEVFDKPFKVLINLDETSDNEKPITEDSAHTVFVTAREEIMEVLRDPKSREKISKILELRNMTIDELVEQRERGSSQIHLADIFHNNSMEPEPQEDVLISFIESSNMNAHITRQQKSRSFEDKPTSNNKVQTLKANNLYNEHITNPLTANISTLNTDSQSKKNKELDAIVYFRNNTDNQNLSNPLDFFSEILNVDNREHTIGLSSTENFNNQDIFKEHDMFFKLPSGVKSAIFVSIAIIGLSIVVFLSILLVFKWSQLKNRKVNYCNSLRSKFDSAILQERSTSAIKTFVTETLGKKKDYYKNNLYRMCDNIWENDKGRKLSF